MSHISSHIIIDAVAPSDSEQLLRSAKIELQFASGTPIEHRAKMYRRAERLIEQLSHEDEHEDPG